jgi:hypothetical protein
MCGARSRSARPSLPVFLVVVVALIACLTQHTTLAQQQNVVGGKLAARAKLTPTSTTKKKRRLFWRKNEKVKSDRNGKSVIQSLWIKLMKGFNMVDENDSENLHLDEAIMFMKAVFVSIFLAYLPSIQRRFERVGEDLATNQANEEGGGEF